MLERVVRELNREHAVQRLRIFETQDEYPLERSVAKIASSFEAPIALLSVVRGDRLWSKAAIGLDFESELRSNTFCEHVLDTDVPLEVCDATKHDLFRLLPPVTGPANIRYYLGVRLRLECGIGVGSLCILDTVPRPPVSADQLAFLQAIARQTAATLELRAGLQPEPAL